MCTNIMHQAEIEGCGKGVKGWFNLSGLRVSYDWSVTKICGRQVGHAANSSAWPSARSGTGAEVP
jgi:hypothetical protein